MIKQAVVIAGGKGRRLAPFTDTNPKPMYPIKGIPFIERLILQIKSFGINRVCILLGYKPWVIKDHLRDGSQYGLSISYDTTPEDYETGGRFLHAKEMLDDEFLFMYCDNYCPIDFKKLITDYRDHDSLIQITAYANKDNYTKNNLLIEEETGRVLCYDKKRERNDTEGVDIGYAIVNKRILGYLSDFNTSFEAVVYPEIVKQGKMFATISEHRYYSIGSWERMSLTEQFFSETKTVFLDRDGTINVRPPRAHYVEKEEDFIWIDGAIEAIKLLRDNNYRIILVTNQPGIARGNITYEALNRIHEKMQRDLIEAGVKDGIDDIYVCPHNWDEGCECRKPKPGMLFQAQKRYSLNLTKCVLIGDDERDIEAGLSARCRCIQITEEYTILDAVNDMIEDEAEYYS